MLNLNKHTKKTKRKPKSILIFKNCSYVCISLCTTVEHNTAQNSSDDLILQTIIIAHMMYIGGEGDKNTQS